MFTSSNKNSKRTFQDFMYVLTMILNSLLIVSILAKWLNSLTSKD